MKTANPRSAVASTLLGGRRPITRDRDKGGFRPTVVQFPTRPVNNLTAKQQRSAKEATYLGHIREAADLMRAAITESGSFSGLVTSLAQGILGLPLSLQGDADMCAALLDAEGTEGEYGMMLPENEAAQVFADGVVLGVGLGQMIEPQSGIKRPIGSHIVPRLRWWDPRWLRQDPYSRQWYLMTTESEIQIEPGDGEWFMFQPYPGIDPWRHGPWLYLTIAFVFARDAIFDRQRHSEVLSPTRVARAQKPTTKESRKAFEIKLRKMQRDNFFVLPEQYIYEIVSATGDFKDVYSSIIDWARRDAEIGLTGNQVGIEGNKGFTSADVYQRVTNSKRRFYAKAWFRDVRNQVLSYWGLDNYGTSNVPTGGYNCESPEDALAAAKFIEQWGISLEEINNGLGYSGNELDPDWVKESMQRIGVRIRQKPAGSAPAAKLEFAPTDLVNFVTVNEGRISEGLGPIVDGELTIAAYSAKHGGGSGVAPPGINVPRLVQNALLMHVAAERSRAVARKVSRRAK